MRIQLRLCAERPERHGQGPEGRAHPPEHPDRGGPGRLLRGLLLCVKSCISGALSSADGVIRVDRDKCVGCYTCVLVCPYGCILPTQEGPVQKCELCLETSAGSPACVRGCPNRAIVYEER